MKPWKLCLGTLVTLSSIFVSEYIQKGVPSHLNVVYRPLLIHTTSLTHVTFIPRRGNVFLFSSFAQKCFPNCEFSSVQVSELREQMLERLYSECELRVLTARVREDALVHALVVGKVIPNSGSGQQRDDVDRNSPSVDRDFLEIDHPGSKTRLEANRPVPTLGQRFLKVDQSVPKLDRNLVG